MRHARTIGSALPTPAPVLPLQLRRLCLRADCRLWSMLHPELPHQLSTFTGLEALQVPIGGQLAPM